MRTATCLASLCVASLLLAAAQTRADEPAVRSEAQPAPPGESQEPRPQADDANDPTWFGMGFESRQERFRREQGLPASTEGHGGNGAGGAGNGGRH